MFEIFFSNPLSAFRKGTLVFQAPWPVWILGVLALLGVAVVAYFVWVRTRSAGWPVRRSLVLWSMQSALVVALLLLLWQPGLSVSTLKKQQNVVAVVMDDSQSMGITEDGVSRRDAVRKTLESGLLKDLKQRFQVRFYRVSDHLERLESPDAAPAAKPASRLAEGLRQIAAETGSLPIGGVVLLSDGADTAGGIDRETVNQLKGRQVPVHTVGYGREQYARDIGLVDVQTPVRALADSRLGAQVTFRQRGYAGQQAKLTVKDGDKILATRSVNLGVDGVAQTETVLFNAGAAGIRTLRVSMETLSGDEAPGNNQMSRLVQVQDRKPRILYIEGEPRWEFKFIRRALEEDKHVHLVTMLRTTQNKIYRQGVKDAKELETGFPATAEEMFSYDGIIIGTVEASYFTPTQQALLKAFVDRRGGGLLFLGGRTSLADGGYAASDLAEVLPVTIGERRTTFFRDKATVELTANGRENLALRLEEDPARNAERWKKLPFLADFQRAGTPKPGALVSVEGITAQGRIPLLISQNYGRGRTAIFATGGSWRWQMTQPLEDQTHESFWQQFARWLVTGTPGPVVSSTSHSVFADQTKIPLRAEVRGKQFELVNDVQVEARVSGPAGASGTVVLTADPVQPGVFTGEYAADKPGEYLVETVADRNGERIGSDVIAFRREDGVAESFSTEQNRELLERLSAETGGSYWKPDNTTKLAEELALSEGGISTREIRDLWSLPIVFLLLAALRAGEWLLRRRWGAV